MCRSLPASGQGQDRPLRRPKQLGGWSAEGFGASLARAIGAEVVVAEDAGGMAVGEIDLDGVVAYLRRGLSAGFGLVDGQKRRGGEIHGGHGVFLGALVIAGGTGAMLAEVGEVVVAGMTVSPGDVDAGARFDVDFDAGGLFALIDRGRHSGNVSYLLSVSVISLKGFCG
jgi:hypothetical protein